MATLKSNKSQRHADEKAARDNRSRQLNPKDIQYKLSRGYEGRLDPFLEGSPKKPC